MENSRRHDVQELSWGAEAAIRECYVTAGRRNIDRTCSEEIIGTHPTASEEHLERNSGKILYF